MRRKGGVGRREKRAWTKEVLRKVIIRLRELTKTDKELLKYIEEVEILVSLFGLGVEVKDMIRGEIDITKTSLFQEGRKEGERIGFRKGEKVGERRGESRGEKKAERKGRVEELKRAILLAVRIRFGKNKAEVLEKKLKKTGDIRELRSIYMKALKSDSWSDFLRSIKNNAKGGK